MVDQRVCVSLNLTFSKVTWLAPIATCILLMTLVEAIWPTLFRWKVSPCGSACQASWRTVLLLQFESAHRTETTI